MSHLDSQLITASGYSRIELLDSVGSTNAYGREILTGDALTRRAWGELSLVATGDQNAGKGRLDRAWVAPPGTSLATTFIVRPHANPHREIAPDRYHWLTSLAALAACDALGKLYGLNPSIKWPNDVLVGNRKICGVLAQLVIEPEGNISVLVGIGTNLNMDRDQLPVPTATSALVESGKRGNLTEALNLLASSFERHYREFAEGGFDAEAGSPSLLERLRNRMSTLGAHLTIHLPGDKTFSGIGVDLTGQGELVVRAEDGEEGVFSVGDVVHVRPRGYGS